jgi:hypothetical protein|tara:strand:+ start:137 stop:811 length:675 start_codon:yes stop_codon:yes gene_type:complete
VHSAQVTAIEELFSIAQSKSASIQRRDIAMNISKKQILGLGLMAAIASVQANAKDFSYTYVEGGFADVDIDNNDADYIYGGGSLALDRNIFIRGSLGNLDVDRVSEFDTVSIGVGHPMKMSERSDLVLAMDYSFAEADRGNADIDTLTGSAMTRTWLTNNVEGNLMGGLAYQDADYGGSDTGAVVGAGIRVYVVPQFSVGANISRSFIGDLDTDEIGLNARLQF